MLKTLDQADAGANGLTFWKVTMKDLESNKESVYVTNYVCLATGHHGKPLEVNFPGQESFPGSRIIKSQN